MNTNEKNKPPLNVVLLCTSSHLGSVIIINKLVSSPEITIKGIVCTPPISFSKEGLQRLKEKMKKLGWHFSFLLVWIHIWNRVGQLTHYLFPTNRKIMSINKLSRKYNIPLNIVDSIHSESSKSFLSKHSPDLIISAFFCQILKADIFNIPKKGTLNIHPGWLPAYRGAMSYFWALKNKEDFAGASIHYIDENIDTGKLICRKQFKIKPGMTQHTVLIKSATIGAILLRRILKKIALNIDIPSIKTDHETPAYYGFPGNTEFDTYFKKNRFFRIRDIFGYFLK